MTADESRPPARLDGFEDPAPSRITVHDLLTWMETGSVSVRLNPADMYKISVMMAGIDDVTDVHLYRDESIPAGYFAATLRELPHA